MLEFINTEAVVTIAIAISSILFVRMGRSEVYVDIYRDTRLALEVSEEVFKEKRVAEMIDVISDIAQEVEPNRLSYSEKKEQVVEKATAKITEFMGEKVDKKLVEVLVLLVFSYLLNSG